MLTPPKPRKNVAIVKRYAHKKNCNIQTVGMILLNHIIIITDKAL